MSAAEIDREELEIFLEEMEELVEILEEDIIKLEKEADNPSLLAEIFRAAHTLKGSAGSMGFMELGKLAHSMESVFAGVRDGSIKISAPLIDVFLKCTDALGAIKDEISEHMEVQTDVSGFMQGLAGILSNESSTQEEVEEKHRETQSFTVPAPQAVSKAPAAPPQDQVKKFVVSADAKPDCAMPFVRALQALTFMADIGSIVESNPSTDEIENEARAFPLTFTVSTNESEIRIRETLGLISDITVTAVAELTDEDLPGEQPEVNVPDPIVVKQSVPEQSVDEEMSEPVSPEPEPGQDATAPPPDTDKKGCRDKKPVSSRSVRVNVERMDAIMDLVGELVIKRTRLSQLARTMEMSREGDDINEYITETSDNIERITAQLQEHIMKARLLPLESVFNKFPRIVRDLAARSGKDIDLIISGEKTELDRSVLEQIGDPMMHIIRNSVDHGIETREDRVRAGKPPKGTIRISAGREEDYVLVTVEDDGRGVDTARVLARVRELNIAPPEIIDRLKEEDVFEFIFSPGFSTRETAGELSGRGVGMDVVRTNIEKLNGNVLMKSSPGKGASIIIKLPLTLAIINSLLVTAGKRIFAVPLISVVQTLRVTRDELKVVKGQETILFRDSVLPLLRLDEELGFARDPARKQQNRVFIVVVSWSGRQAGLVVDSLIGDQEIVIRPLGDYIGDVPGISGAAILGDGNISLIIDVGGIIKGRVGATADISS